MDDSSELEPLLCRVRRTAILSDLEARQIQEILAQQQCKLQQLSGQITEARAMLVKLLAEEAEATRTSDAYRSLLSPIRRLPLELFGIIFVCCLPDDLFVKPAKNQAPLLLTQICASWRAMALSIPELWSSLCVAYHVTGRGKGLKDIDRTIAPSMGLWLSRSGSLPLSISIKSMVIKQSILDVLFHHSARCRRLQLKGIQFWSGLQIPNGDFPILEQLYVQSHIVPFSSMFASAPQLHEVSWRDVLSSDSDDPSLTLSLPWAQLKRLTLIMSATRVLTSVGMLLDMFAMCPLLEYACVTFRGVDVVPPRNQILLPNLSSLALHACGPNDVYTPLFTYLTTPSLRSLTCVSGTAWPSQVFLSFINRSACALDGLYLRHLKQLTQITEYLQVVSNSVKCLVIHNQARIVTDELLNLLTPTLKTPCLCPNLEILHLVGSVSRSQGALAAMVRSRLLLDENAYQSANNQTAKLKKLCVLHSEGDLDELHDLQRFSLILKITYDVYDLGFECDNT
jgi:hypothetical protein